MLFCLLFLPLALADCCEDEERRLFVSRQGHGVGPQSSGTKKDCKCESSSSKNTTWMVWCGGGVLFVLIAAITAGLIVMKRPRRGPVTVETQVESQVEMAKFSLRDADEEANLCPICLEGLDGHVVHPANCGHVFHSACIETWLETATARSLQRTLSCPTCAASMLPSV